MNLFGDVAGPHIARFHARHKNGRVELDWEVRNADTIRCRVLRSTWGFAVTAEPPGTNEQVLVNESPTTYLADQGLDKHTHYFYTVFSQEADGGWQRQVEAKVRPRDLLSWLHPQAQQILDTDADQGTHGGIRVSTKNGTFVMGQSGRRTAEDWLRKGGD